MSEEVDTAFNPDLQGIAKEVYFDPEQKEFVECEAQSICKPSEIVS